MLPQYLSLSKAQLCHKTLSLLVLGAMLEALDFHSRPKNRLGKGFRVLCTIETGFHDNIDNNFK